MPGTIRFIAGLLMTLGAVGTLDVDPSASVLIQGALAVCGLAIMWSGVSAIKQSQVDTF